MEKQVEKSKHTPNEKQNAERFLKWSKIERLHWRKSTCWNWIECCVFYVFVSVVFFSVVVPSRECFIACKCFSISSREFYWNVYLNLFTLTRAPLLTSLYSLYSDFIFFSRGFNSDSNFSFYVLQVSLMRVTDKEEQIEKEK